MAERSRLGDCCQNHNPLTAPVVYPYAVGFDQGSFCAWYRCDCGREWSCHWDMAAAGWTFEDVLCHGMDCRDCASEIRLTRGARGYRMRIIHSDGCPWLPRYLVGTLDPRTDYTGAIPCGTAVTHRGPYKRDPERRSAA